MSAHAQSSRSAPRDEQATTALSAATLTALAVAQPVLAVVAAGPTFLVVHGAGRREMVWLVGLLCVALPLLAAAAAFAATRWGGRFGRAAVAAGLGLLAALAAMPLLARIPGVPAWLIALALGALLAWSYPRWRGIRWWLVALSPALLAVPLAFVLDPQVRRATTEGDRGELQEIDARTPVVMVVLDEWTFASILDPEWVLAGSTEPPGDAAGWRGALDRARLPRLAAFAERATWYSNATTVSDATELAVPAVLTGRFPRREALPVLADHPDNLFTRLAGSYRISALEPIATLCPPEVNRLSLQEDGDRVERLLEDAALVWLHAVAPPPLRRRLPPIAERWSGFLEHSGGTADALTARPRESARQGRLRDGGDYRAIDRVDAFRRFLSTIEPGDRQLYFAHLLLPHVPFEHLPSGEAYPTTESRLPGMRDDRWSDVQRLADQALQRYLLQVSFVDRLLGELFDSLEEVGLFDDAVVVLVADHGASFRAGAARRMFEPANAADVVPVPLFVKLPGQREGAVSLEPVTTLDVLPTVLDAIGTAAGPGLEGRSLLREHDRDSVQRRFCPKHRKDVTFAPGEDPADRRLAAARRQAELLSRAGGDLYLVGLPAGAAVVPPDGLSPPASAEATARAVLDGTGGGASSIGLRERGGMFEGTLHGLPPENACCVIALARGGRMVAAGPVYRSTSGRSRFALVVPPPAEAGETYALYRIDEASALHAVELASESGRLELGRDGVLSAVSLDGHRYPADPSVEGYLDLVRARGERVVASGWAMDRATRRPADWVALFLDERLIASGPVENPRSDVAAERGEGLAHSGFEIVFRLDEPERLQRDGIVAVAIAGEHSTRLRYFYSELIRSPDGSAEVVAGDGRHLAVRSTALRGWIDQVVPEPTTGMRLVGWAADVGRGRPAERVVAFEHGAYLAETWPGLRRDDVAVALGEAVRDSGFVLGLARAPEALLRGELELVVVGRDGDAAFLTVAPEQVSGAASTESVRATAPRTARASERPPGRARPLG